MSAATEGELAWAGWMGDHPGWARERCGACRGHGVVSDYSTGDFEGPKECDGCWGNGSVWRSPKDRLALYPGGPFIGYDPRPHGSE